MCDEIGLAIDAPIDVIRKSAIRDGYTLGEIEAAFKDFELAMNVPGHTILTVTVKW
jgi:hypothetical protein